VIEHGGREYDALYPEGIPTSVEIDHASLGTLGGTSCGIRSAMPDPTPPAPRRS
jgi:hypothetical protein